MFCKHCGTELNDGAKFCIKCGSSIVKENINVQPKAFQHGEFRFSRTWLRYFVILAVILTVSFGLIGSYDEGFVGAFIGVLFLSVLFSALITIIIKWRKKGYVFERVSNVSSEELEKYNGIGGWLMIVILGLLINTAMQAYGIYESISLFTNGAVEYLSNPTSNVYIPGYGVILKFELILDVLFLVASGYLIYLFYKKSRLFPNYYIFFLVASAIYVFIDYLIFASISYAPEAKVVIDEVLSEQGSEIARAFISALIWGSYMAKSKRVKATFIEQ